MEVIWNQGLIIQFQKKTSFIQKQLVSHWPPLVCPISPFPLNEFQSSLISLKSYFQGESNAVCYERRGLLFMENVGNYRNCTTQIILELFGVYPIRTYPFWTFPFTCSPLISNHLKSFLVWILGRNMSFTSSIQRV